MEPPVKTESKALIQPFSHGLPAPFNRLPTDLVKEIFDKLGVIHYKALLLVCKKFKPFFAKNPESLMRKIIHAGHIITEPLGITNPIPWLEDNCLKVYHHVSVGGTLDTFLFSYQIHPTFQQIGKPIREDSHPIDGYIISKEKPSFVPEDKNDFLLWAYQPNQCVIGYSPDQRFHIWSIKVCNNILDRLNSPVKSIAERALKDVERAVDVISEMKSIRC